MTLRLNRSKPARLGNIRFPIAGKIQSTHVIEKVGLRAKFVVARSPVVDHHPDPIIGLDVTYIDAILFELFSCRLVRHNSWTHTFVARFYSPSLPIILVLLRAIEFRLPRNVLDNPSSFLLICGPIQLKDDGPSEGTPLA